MSGIFEKVDFYINRRLFQAHIDSSLKAILRKTYFVARANACISPNTAARLHSDGALDTAYGIVGLMRTNYGFAVDV